MMAENVDYGSLDFDEVLAFVEVVTRDRDALSAQGGKWDAR